MEKQIPQINITYLYKEFRLSPRIIREIFSYILKKEEANLNCSIDVVFMNNDAIKKLNKVYRKKNKPTDVLAFNISSEDEDEFLNPINLLGEIIISTPYAKEQAKKQKHSLKKEVVFLLIHGLLHLLGYDDLTVPDYEKMMAKQKEYFAYAVNNIL
ncbi:MAG: rRNA maturation RNase YbeY [Armatimonadota bacterium]